MNVIISEPGRILPKGNTGKDFPGKLVTRLGDQYPHYKFFYLSYDNNEDISPLPANVQTIISSQPAITKPVTRWWRRRKLAQLVKQLNADTVLHIHRYLPVAGVKEWLLQDNIIDEPEHLKSLTGIITYSYAIKNALIKKGIDSSVIKVIHCLPDNSFKPLDWDTRESLKQSFTNGKEYLLFDAADTTDAHMLNVLKGFSAIKKWLKTGMQLIIINAILHKGTENLLNTYKYKSDVSILKNGDEYQYHGLLAAAFAFIYIPQSQVNELPLLQAMQCAVPTITYKADPFFELCDLGAMYIDPDNENDIGEKLMKVCKDEKTRLLLTQNATDQLELLKKNNSSAAVFE